VLYASVQVMTQGVLGAGITQHADAPLAAVAERVLGIAGRSLSSCALHSPAWAC
jgi:hypothetical protein